MERKYSNLIHLQVTTTGVYIIRVIIQQSGTANHWFVVRVYFHVVRSGHGAYRTLATAIFGIPRSVQPQLSVLQIHAMQFRNCKFTRIASSWDLNARKYVRPYRLSKLANYKWRLLGYDTMLSADHRVSQQKNTVIFNTLTMGAAGISERRYTQTCCRQIVTGLIYFPTKIIFAVCWIRDSNSGKDKGFVSSPKRTWLWGPPNLLLDGYQGSFPGGKGTGAWSWPLTSI
jgi:hypothetical protein